MYVKKSLVQTVLPRRDTQRHRRRQTAVPKSSTSPGACCKCNDSLHEEIQHGQQKGAKEHKVQAAGFLAIDSSSSLIVTKYISCIISYICIFVCQTTCGLCLGHRGYTGPTGLELYTHRELYKGRYNQHSTLHGSGAVIPTG